MFKLIFLGIRLESEVWMELKDHLVQHSNFTGKIRETKRNSRIWGSEIQIPKASSDPSV